MVDPERPVGQNYQSCSLSGSWGCSVCYLAAGRAELPELLIRVAGGAAVVATKLTAFLCVAQWA